MEDNLDFKGLMVKLLRKWRSFVVFGIIFAVVVGGINFLRGYQSFQSPENQADNLEYQQSLAEYELALENIDTAFSQAKNNLENTGKYLDNSILMRVNPYEVNGARAVLYLDVPEQGLPQEYDVASDLRFLYTSYVDDDALRQIVEELALDTSVEYLSEAVSIGTRNLTDNRVVNNHTLLIDVMYPDSETALNIADSIVSVLMNKQAQAVGAMGEHKISLVNRTTYSEMSLDLLAKQNKKVDEVNSLKKSVEDFQSQAKALVKPSLTSASMSSVVSGAVKYAMLGGVLGVFVVGLVVLLSVLMGNKVMDEGDLKERYHTRILAVLAKQKKGGI